MIQAYRPCLCGRGNRDHERKRTGKFQIGILNGQLTGAGPDFLEPMTESDLAVWEGTA
jgi:hypothetical protein